MATIGFVAFWEIIILFTLGLVALPTPMGIPPLPEDPALVRAAPADTLLYLQWFGNAEPDPKSPNATERLSAEPEVRTFLRRVGRAIQNAAAHDAEHGELVREAMSMAGVALRRPGCAFVNGDFAGGGMGVAGGAVLNLGDDAAKAATLLRKIEGAMVATAPDAIVPDAVVVEGISFRPFPLERGAPPVFWGVVDGYLVITVGEELPAQVVRGLRGGAGLTGNPAFAEVHTKVRVARPCFRTFLDLGRVLAMAQTAGGEEVKSIVSALGLGNVRGVLSESGLEGDGFTSRNMLVMSGERTGVMKLLAERPLSPADVAVIPADATLAVAARCGPRAVYGLLRDTLAKLEPRAERELDRGVEQLEGMLGIDLEKDLLAHLGDTVCAWNSPGQGGLLITGATLAVSLADAKAFRATFDKVMARVEQIAPKKERQRGRFRRGVFLGRTEHRGTVIHFLNTIGDDVPVAPAWCVTDTHLMFSLFPQMLKASIERGPEVQTSVAQHLAFADPPRAVAMTHLDAEATFRVVYPLLYPLGQLLAAEMQREGFELDITALPTMGAIVAHLGRETSRVEVLAEGVLVTREGTVPAADPVAGMLVPVALWTSFAYRSMGRAREMEMRVQVERARAERARVELLKALEKEKAREEKGKKKLVPMG